MYGSTAQGSNTKNKEEAHTDKRATKEVKGIITYTVNPYKINAPTKEKEKNDDNWLITTKE